MINEKDKKIDIIYDKIVGVYHIKGTNWSTKSSSDQFTIDNITNVTNNYDIVIKHAYNYAIERKYKYVLHLAKIPGFLFAGNSATYIGMIIALAKNIDKLSSENFYISLDISENDFNSVKNLLKDKQYKDIMDKNFQDLDISENDFNSVKKLLKDKQYKDIMDKNFQDLDRFSFIKSLLSPAVLKSAPLKSALNPKAQPFALKKLKYLKYRMKYYKLKKQYPNL